MTERSGTIAEPHPDCHRPWRVHPARLIEKVVEAPGVATYCLELTSADDVMRCAPGQFTMIYIPTVGEAAVSVSGHPDAERVLAHTVREAGSVTHALAELPVGATLGLRGPFGRGWPMEEARHRDVILVAGGIGLAPLRPVIYSIIAQRSEYGNVTVLCGARSPAGLLYTKEYEDWRRHDIAVKTTVDQAENGWAGNVGVVTSLLDRLAVGEPQSTLLMTCGPEIMMWYTVQTALHRGLSADLLFVSLERHMNCAVGLCGHCQFGPEFVCRDGPVFAFPQVARLLKIHDL